MFISEALAETDTITIKDTDITPEAPQAMESGWTSIIPMVLILAIFYFLLIRPQEKRRKEQEAFVAGVKNGEEVVTNAGLYGTVRKINDSDNTIMLEIASGVEVKILKNSIADITNRKSSDKTSGRGKAEVSGKKSKKNVPTKSTGKKSSIQNDK